MSETPRIEQRTEQPYLGIPVETSMQEEPRVIASHLQELQAWLRAEGIAATGAPFVRYRRIKMPELLAIEVCLPVQTAPPGDGRVRGNAIPEGRYAVLVHQGPVSGLVEANARLQRWAREQGLDFLTQDSGDVEGWTSRIETYLSDPQQEPDASQHRTEIAYLLKS
ncbi:GyrI-like domain-containing protein [Hydrogenophaga sp.]|uniref:GyrI-like domain-containing protein n=1 Tax=Hydrogenophaga sp. TaxID=1904254 RepID=UPI003F6F157C